MADIGQAALQALLDRLLAGLLNGPGLNCRPHASRQRIDLTAFSRLKDGQPSGVLTELLSSSRKAKIVGRVAAPARSPQTRPNGTGGLPENPLKESKEPIDPAQREWQDQQAVITKVRNIAEDAKTYEQDTGVHVLSVGFPLLSIPSGGVGSGGRRRILAPIAFIPVDVTVTRGAHPSISVECHGSGADLVVPNDALLAWLEQQQKAQPEEFFTDIEGEQPWREIACLVGHVAQAVGIAVPAMYAGGDVENWQPELSDFQLQTAPRAEDETAPAILNTAILGLYPMTNQGLIRDTKALVAGEPLLDPAQSFVKVGLGLGEAIGHPEKREPGAPAGHQTQQKSFHDERLVSTADPCQAKAVRLARTCRGLVIHGPPGTGKSQTITNVIGDHLARGERVLMVCDKRTALDIVYYRLQHLGLASLCAVVHDPQRDQRNFYKSVRGQIDELVDAKSSRDAENTLRRVDDELSRLHIELTAHRGALMERPSEGEMSVHELIGNWLELPEPPVQLDESVSGTSLAQLNDLVVPLAELFKLAGHVGYPKNPWTPVAGISLADFLKLPMAGVRRSLSDAAAAGIKADEAAHASIPEFAPQPGIAEQGEARVLLADLLEKAIERVAPDVRTYWAKQDSRSVAVARQKITDSQAMLDRLREKRMDTELAIAARSNVPMIATVAQQTATLDAYLQIARKWHAFLHMKQKKMAGQVLIHYGLTLSPDAADRLRTFLRELRERLILSQVYYDVSAQARHFRWCQTNSSTGRWGTIRWYLICWRISIRYRRCRSFGKRCQRH